MPLETIVTVRDVGLGTVYGYTSDRRRVLIQYQRSHFSPEQWAELFPLSPEKWAGISPTSISKNPGRCGFRMVEIDQIELFEGTMPRPGKARSSTPVEIPSILQGEIWRSTRGKHERFEIMSDVGPDGLVKLLGIDTPGYRRDTQVESFVKFYYKDTPNDNPVGQAETNHAE